MLEETKILLSGYQKLTETWGFEELIGSLYSKNQEDDFVYAFKTIQKLASRSGNVHGGFIMMAADHIMSFDILRRKDRPFHIATVQLNCQFIDRVPIDELLFVYPKILRKTRHLIFTEAQIHVGSRLLFQASGIWKIVDPNSTVARQVEEGSKKSNSIT